MQSIQVDNLKKPELVKNGYYNIKDWLSYLENLYIGREVDYPNVYIQGSKWGNPFPLSKYTLEDCLKRYEDYVRNGKLYDELEELDSLTLGCWCYPNPCHGDVLIKLLNEKKAKANAKKN